MYKEAPKQELTEEEKILAASGRSDTSFGDYISQYVDSHAPY